MRYRSIVSLTIVYGFLAISITGLLLYVGLKSEAVEIIHVLFGLLFVVFVIFHIRYNFDAIRNYSLVRKTIVIRKELIVTSVISISLLVGMSLEFHVMEDLSHAGRALFEGKRRQRRGNEVLMFNAIATNQTTKGTSLRFIIWLGKQVIAPVIVIWTMDSEARNVETLFLPAKVMRVPGEISNYWDFEKMEVRGEVQYHNFDPTVLSEFNRQGNSSTPNYKSTPVGSFILDTRTRFNGSFTIYLELRFAGKTELYRTVVDIKRDTVLLLYSPIGTLLKEGIVKVTH